MLSILFDLTLVVALVTSYAYVVALWTNVVSRNQWHHGHIGFALLFLAASRYPTGSPWWLLVLAAAGWLMADDLYQHERQRTEPAYRSPIHRWTVPIYKVPAIAWAARTLDRLMGWVAGLLKGKGPTA